LYVNLFVSSASTIQLDKRLPVAISQQTQYPWDGKVSINISPEEESQFTLHLRIPGWAADQVTPGDLYSFATPEKDSILVEVNGQPINYTTEKGYALIDRKWKKGDVVTYSIPMSIRRVKASQQVADNAGKVALERGPMVYCLEGVDNDPQLMKLTLPDSALLQAAFTPEMLSGIVTISGNALLTESQKSQQVKFTAIPYYAWNNRGANEMKVWMAEK
jgi:DUF1680 family protein